MGSFKIVILEGGDSGGEGVKRQIYYQILWWDLASLHSIKVNVTKSLYKIPLFTILLTFCIY